MNYVDPKQLYEWCRIPAEALPGHPELRVAFRVVRDSVEMGQTMAQDLVKVIEANSQAGLPSRAIIPCGPNCWYAPFTELVNSRSVSLRSLTVFHMDECLDWQARPLPANHPYNFRTFMEKSFYGGIAPKLAVPEAQRFWLLPSTIEDVQSELTKGPVDITM